MKLADHIKQIESMVQERKGSVPSFLVRTIRSAAMTSAMEEKLFDEMMSLPSLMVVETGSMGQMSEKPHPMIDKFSQVQTQMLKWLSALGLTFSADPDKVEQSTSASEKETDPLAELLKSRK